MRLEFFPGADFARRARKCSVSSNFRRLDGATYLSDKHGNRIGILPAGAEQPDGAVDVEPRCCERRDYRDQPAPARPPFPETTH